MARRRRRSRSEGFPVRCLAQHISPVVHRQDPGPSGRLRLAGWQRNPASPSSPKARVPARRGQQASASALASRAQEKTVRVWPAPHTRDVAGGHVTAIRFRTSRLSPYTFMGYEGGPGFCPPLLRSRLSSAAGARAGASRDARSSSQTCVSSRGATSASFGENQNCGIAQAKSCFVVGTGLRAGLRSVELLRVLSADQSRSRSPNAYAGAYRGVASGTPSLSPPRSTHPAEPRRPAGPTAVA